LGDNKHWVLTIIEATKYDKRFLAQHKNHPNVFIMDWINELKEKLSDE
jgi:hypothetical protein